MRRTSLDFYFLLKERERENFWGLAGFEAILVKGSQ